MKDLLLKYVEMKPRTEEDWLAYMYLEAEITCDYFEELNKLVANYVGEGNSVYFCLNREWLFCYNGKGFSCSFNIRELIEG